MRISGIHYCMRTALWLTTLISIVIPLCACGAKATDEKHRASVSGNQGAKKGPLLESSETAFRIDEFGKYREPWAMAFAPGTDVLFLTEKGGKVAGFDTANERAIFVTGAPTVDYGGQGGLGDILFLPSESAATLTPRTIFLSWAEAGEGDTRGAAVGKGRLVCEDHQTCRIRDLAVIWRQSPIVTGRGHYSHRLALSPDERFLFVASGERQKQDPAQDLANTLGTIVRLDRDGKAAAGNPFAGKEGQSNEIWSYGHRNILGLRFDALGRLWDLEHGPAGGDELNLVEPGKNYGWPVVSNGDHYDGDPIPDHATRPEFTAPAISWTPVIAPGDFIFYSGELFPEWQGQALITGLKSQALVRVGIEGEKATELARYDFGERLRSIVEAPNGALWVIEDGKQARLLRLAPR